MNEPIPSAPTPPKRLKQKLWTRDFILGTLTNFVISANYFMLMVVMTAYAMTVYQAPASLAAFCASVFVIGTLVARFTSALLLERVALKTLLVIGTLLEATLTALYFLHGALGLLIVVRFTHGFAFGTCSTVVTTLVTSMVPIERKGEGIGYFMLSVTLGAAIGPFAGIFISNNLGYPTLFAIATAIACISLPLALAIRVPKDATRANRKHAQSGATERAKAQTQEQAAADEVAANFMPGTAEGAREIYAGERQDGELAATNLHTSKQAVLPHTPNQKQSFASKFIEANVLPISLVACIIFFGYSSLLTFLTPFATELGLARAASVFFIVYAISMFITRPFTGKAFDRSGARPVMTPAFFAFSGGMLLLAFATNDWMILGAALLLGFGVGTIQSCGLAVAVRKTPDERLSKANATFYLMLDLGVGIGPVLLGAVQPLIGYHAMYIGMAALGLAALILFLNICGDKRVTIGRK